MKSKSKKPDTLLAHAGRDPAGNFGVVNPPVYHASTIIHQSVAELEKAQKNRYGVDQVVYGRYGTPTTFALEQAVAALEGGPRAIAHCSGAAACYSALLAFVNAGDHVLVTDSVYGPVRAFCNNFLARFGVETTFYDPTLGQGIEKLFKPNTKLLYMESPGSLTFEIQDVRALVAAVKSRGIKTALDNTWAAPLFFKPLALGVDVEIIAGTKYIVGHSDAMMGLVVSSEDSFLPLREAATQMGNQNHANANFREVIELIQAGAIGPVPVVAHAGDMQHPREHLHVIEHLEIVLPELEAISWLRPDGAIGRALKAMLRGDQNAHRNFHNSEAGQNGFQAIACVVPMAARRAKT